MTGVDWHPGREGAALKVQTRPAAQRRPQARGRGARLLTAGAFILAIAVALALRLPQLDRRPMHGDEAVHAIKFRTLWEQGVYRYDPDEFHGPSLYYLTLPAMWLSGTRDFADSTEATFRTVPALLGAGLIGLLWLLRDGLGRSAAICAAILVAVSPAMVFYSRYYIHETPFVFFSLAAIACGWRYTRSKRGGWAVLTGACLGLMFATKETSVIVYAAMAVAAGGIALWSRIAHGTTGRPCAWGHGPSGGPQSSGGTEEPSLRREPWGNMPASSSELNSPGGAEESSPRREPWGNVPASDPIPSPSSQPRRGVRSSSAPTGLANGKEERGDEHPAAPMAHAMGYSLTPLPGLKTASPRMTASASPRGTAPLRVSWTYRRAAHLLLAVGAALLVCALLYSSFFAHPRGLLDSLRTFGPWSGRVADKSPHVHPWHYYLALLAYTHWGPGPVWSEGLILILAAAGLVAAFTGRALPAQGLWLWRFVGIYTIALMVAHSLIPYKTPWNMLGFLTGLILLAGAGAAWVLRRAPGLPLKALVALPLLAGAGHLAWQAQRASFRFCADGRNPYVYAQPTADVVHLAELAERLAAVHPHGHRMQVHVVASPWDYWPLPWYLRRFPNVGYWEQPSARARAGAPLIIASADLQPAVDASLRRPYHSVYFGLRPDVMLLAYVQQDLWEQFIRSRSTSSPTSAATRPGAANTHMGASTE